MIKFIDGKGKSITMAGSCDLKGIKGTDKRKYVIDLLRLSVRDLNYLGDEFQACVLR